jgi:hypothetical protein
MRSAYRAAALIALVAAISACNEQGGSAPGAVSEGEAQALEEAAEMLDERQLPEGVLPPVDMAEDGAETPEPETPQEVEAE